VQAALITNEIYIVVDAPPLIEMRLNLDEDADSATYDTNPIIDWFRNSDFIMRE